MAKRRTKQQKQTAKHTYYYSLDEVVSGASETATSPKEPRRAQKRVAALIAYDPSLIKKDLLRTVTLSTLIIGIEIGLYLFI